MINLHITSTPFLHESRIVKQVRSINKLKEVKGIYIAAKHEDGLKREEGLFEGCTINRFALKSFKSRRSFLGLVVRYFEFVFRVFFFYRGKKIDVVNAHSLALLPLALLFKVFCNSKVIYDAHELETETHALKGVKKKAAKFLEKHLVKYVDKVIVVSESISMWYANSYNIEAPAVVLNSPPYYQLSKVKKISLRDKLNIPKENILCIYQGGLMKVRGVKKLLDVLKDFPEGRVSVVFMGYGDLVDDIKELSKNNTSIYYHPAVEQDVLLDYTSSCDFGLALVENSCLSYDFCMPNKLFEYIQAGLPVVVSDLTEMERFVKNNDLGFVLNLNSPVSIANTLNELSVSKLSKFNENNERAKQLTSWEEQERVLLKEYSELVELI
ncbi:glycosyl transferase family 1 [Pseudoalteromonas rubra]|uniref:Glycosyl transferase family 1 n=1 Tax=Pseudoalteromonas rubra TaxID=43658 RepID=A0A5S3WR46_9GAMM|nr:glycosyltransferase [Pseudoalteromonas rubra]TMP31449.1 glycosyl transferase family 1 [Pseudoalteromonas rubra]TMP34534.1 glycosyl transferase family 1 [Pseudoalteromonas rubra]